MGAMEVVLGSGRGVVDVVIKLGADELLVKASLTQSIAESI